METIEQVINEDVTETSGAVSFILAVVCAPTAINATQRDQSAGQSAPQVVKQAPEELIFGCQTPRRLRIACATPQNVRWR